MKLIKIPYKGSNNEGETVYQFLDFKRWMATQGLDYGTDYTGNWMSGNRELHIILADGNEATFSHIQLVMLIEPWVGYV